MKDNMNVNYGPLPEYIAGNKKEYLDIMRSPLQDYCKEAIKQFGYLDNQGLALDDDDNQGGPVYIDDLYVLPKAGMERISPEMLAKIDDIRNTDEDSEDIKDVNSKVDQLSSIAELIWKNPRLTLLGDPGVGKTTLMQWLICSLCHWSNNHAKQYLGPMFPLTITARKISEKTLSLMNSNDLDIESFVDEMLSMQGDQLNRLWGEEEKAFLYSLFERGQVLLLVDGLDEISNNTEFWLNNKIRNLLIKYPSTHLIMTARVVGFNQFDFWGISKRLRDNEIHVGISDSPIELDEDFVQASKNKQLYLPSLFYLAPFSPDQRKRFSENWVANYLPPNDEKKKIFIENIDEVSAHSFQLDALSRIPVLLNLICFIQWRRGKLPNGRAELYQRIVETYLVAMDRARLLTHELSDEYDYQDIKNWLGRLAFNMQSGDLKLLPDGKDFSDFNENQLEKFRLDLPIIGQERILQVSGDELKRFFQLHLSEVLPSSELSVHAEAIINYLKIRTGFLIPRGVIGESEYFGFSHLSFQEYFCAYFLNNAIDDFELNYFTNLTNAAKKESWSEIFQLLFEEMSLTGRSRTYVDKALLKVFILDGDDSDEIVNNLFPTYAKIINNPSIKLSNAVRYERKEILTLKYISMRGRETSIMKDIANYIAEDWVLRKKKVALLSVHLSNEKIRNIASVIDCSTVTDLTLNDMNVDEYGFTAVFDSLYSLNLSNSIINSIEEICVPKSIEILDVTHAEIFDLSSLKNMTNLVTLRASSGDVSHIYEYLPSISDLRVMSDVEEHADWGFLSDLRELKRLGLFGDLMKGIPKTIEGDKLEDLDVFGSFDVNLLESISNLKKLKSISLYCFEEFEGSHFNMADWNCMENLENLIIHMDCDIDLSDLSKDSNLKELTIHCEKLLNSEELLKLSKLQKLVINEHEITPSLAGQLEAKGVNILLL